MGSVDGAGALQLVTFSFDLWMALGLTTMIALEMPVNECWSVIGAFGLSLLPSQRRTNIELERTRGIRLFN